MNETIKTILSKRSIRAYKQEQIKDENLQLILNAGLFAPSAMNQQSWHFTAVQNKETLQKINQVAKGIILKSGNARLEEMAPSHKVLRGQREAPCVIFILVRKYKCN